MLRTLGLMGGIVLFATTAAAADAPAPLKKAFKSPIVSPYPAGRPAYLWMNPSGTYTSMGRRHDRHSGRWTLKGEKVCFKRGLFGYCTPIPTENAFTTKAVTGETIQVRLTPGRQGETAG